jgi:hypothetical protein
MKILIWDGQHWLRKHLRVDATPHVVKKRIHR